MGIRLFRSLNRFLFASGLSGTLLAQKGLFTAEVCVRIRNLMESNEKLSKHFKSSFLYAHMVL